MLSSSAAHTESTPPVATPDEAKEDLRMVVDDNAAACASKFAEIKASLTMAATAELKAWQARIPEKVHMTLSYASASWNHKTQTDEVWAAMFGTADGRPAPGYLLGCSIDVNKPVLNLGFQSHNEATAGFLGELGVPDGMRGFNVFRNHWTTHDPAIVRRVWERLLARYEFRGTEAAVITKRVIESFPQWA
jgi:hypothetical protein